MMRGMALATLAIDLLAGEPPAWLHPTVAMGRLIARGRARRRATTSSGSFVEGIEVVAGGATLSAGLAFAADRTIAGFPATLALGTRAAALKPAISVRALVEAARDVERALRNDDLARARRLLSWHLVSRDTSRLDSSEVAAATIESLAENLNDAFVAPILAFRVAGLGGAYAFRFVNTADAMLGYRTPELEWFGKSAARCDDVLAFLPARLTTVFIATAAALVGACASGALAVAASDARRTASPCAGWPMAAMAGALDVRLEKREHYVLNPRARRPVSSDIRRARHLVLVAACLAALCVDLI
jgi:adenosylcobinamide-phosphate synthase